MRFTKSARSPQLDWGCPELFLKTLEGEERGKDRPNNQYTVLDIYSFVFVVQMS